MARLKKAKDENNDSVNESQNKNLFSTENLLFIGINVLLVGISTWQTFVGYEADVAGNKVIAFTIALAAGLMFIALNFGIRDRRIKGEKHGLLILMYIIPFGMSFFANFNAFYTNQTKKDFTKNAVREYLTQLDQTKDEAINAIDNSVDINSFEREYNSKLEQLKIEYNKPPAGWGSEAESKWKDLANFFNNEGGSLSSTVLGNTSGSTRYNRALDNADAEKDNIINSRQDKIKSVKESIENKYLPVYTKIDSLMNMPQPVYNSGMLDDLVDAENYIRTQASAFLNNQDIFSTQALKPHSVAESGTIKHSLQKAFIDKENPTATVFSLFFCLIIDLAALLYVLVFYKYKGSSKNKNKSSQGPIPV